MLKTLKMIESELREHHMNILQEFLTFKFRNQQFANKRRTCVLYEKLDIKSSRFVRVFLSFSVQVKERFYKKWYPHQGCEKKISFVINLWHECSI